MHRTILAGLLLLTAGCQNIVGPFQSRDPKRVDDPMISIDEQKVRGRDRLALPQGDPNVLPGASTSSGGSNTQPADAYGRY